VASENGPLDINEILRANAGDGGKLAIMFSKPGELPKITDWRIVLIEVCASIDRNTHQIADLLKQAAERGKDANEQEQA
jgi:hypothetical protein